MTLLHNTTASTRSGGFTFPTGSWFVVNMSSIMMDPENFPEPELFKPERFLGPNGKYVNQTFYLINSFTNSALALRRMRG